MPTTGQIKILYDDGAAHDSVHVAGEFTSWEPVDLGLENGTLYAAIFDGAEPGESYQYKFIVDGTWKLLPGYEQATDAIGNINHVIKATAVPIASDPIYGTTSSEPVGSATDADIGNDSGAAGISNAKDLKDEEGQFSQDEGLVQPRETTDSNIDESSSTIPVTVVDIQRLQRVGGDGPWQVIDQQQDVVVGDRSPEIIEPVEQSSEPAEALKFPSSAESGEPIRTEEANAPIDASVDPYAADGLGATDAYTDAYDTFQKSTDTSTYDSALEDETPVGTTSQGGAEAPIFTETETGGFDYSNAPTSFPLSENTSKAAVPASYSDRTITSQKEISKETGAPRNQIDESTGFPPEAGVPSAYSPQGTVRASGSHQSNLAAAAATAATSSPGRTSAVNAAASRASAYAKSDALESPSSTSATGTTPAAATVSSSKRNSAKTSGDARGEGILSQAERELHATPPTSESKGKFRKLFRKIPGGKH